MPKVIIYSTPSCPYCGKAKEYLAERGIAFEERDIAADASSMRELLDKSGQTGVPTFDIGGGVVIGFDRERLDAILSQMK